MDDHEGQWREGMKEGHRTFRAKEQAPPLDPLSATPSDKELSPEENIQVEWEKDQLVALMGQFLSRRPKSPSHHDSRFLDWLARELRRQPPSKEDWPAERVRAIRERVLERAASLRLSLRLVDSRQPERAASVVAPVAQAVDEAALERCVPWTELGVAAGAGRELWDEACERWIEMPAGMPQGRYLALTVTGDSMNPLIHTGDVVLVKLGTDVRADSVVVARRPDNGYVVKRIGRMSDTRIELTSLNPAFAPIEIPNDRRSVLGTVLLRWCEHGGGSPLSPKSAA